MRNAMRALVSSLLLFVFGAPAIEATIVPTVSFHEMVGQSSQIVTGHVVGSTTSWGAEHKYIWTRYEIAVDRVIKGKPQKTVIVSEPGGSLNGTTMRIAGAVTYRPGEHVAPVSGGLSERRQTDRGLGTRKAHLRCGR